MPSLPHSKTVSNDTSPTPKTTTIPLEGHSHHHQWLNQIIRFCAYQPYFIILITLSAMAWSFMLLQDLSLDAIPDLSDTQVIIVSEWQGQSPDMVEDQITYPLSSALQALPKVNTVRGQSLFGLSFVYVLFEEDTDQYWARSRVLEQLNSFKHRLPSGVQPRLGPDASGVGWIFMYTVNDESGTYDLKDLRAMQDWNIRYALESVHGVAEVASIGGFQEEYHVLLKPRQLQSYQIDSQDITRAIKRHHKDLGAGIIEMAGHEYMIRSQGELNSLQDLSMIPVAQKSKHHPLLLSDVAEIVQGAASRRGLVEWNGLGESVAGIVIMRSGENALSVIQSIKKRLHSIQAGLPEGVHIDIAYDRSQLIEESIQTLSFTLLEELLMVSLIIFLFLLHIRSILIPLVVIPAAIILSFIPLYWQGISTNIMSLGGMAIALGAMVDASIILIDNIHKRLEQVIHRQLTWHERMQIMIDAMCEVGPSIFSSLMILTISFMPIFTLEGIEGRLFKPLALSKTYAMGFAALLAVTLTPALAVLLIKGKIYPEHQHPLNRLMQWIYRPIVRWVAHHPWTIIIASLCLMLVTLPAFLRLESEFMPPLNEGSILYMPTAAPGMSITEASHIAQSMNKKIKAIPEVKSVLAKMGRASTATDSAPLSMAETVIQLKDRSEWRAGLTWDQLIQEMDQRLQYPGMPNIWWMPIQTRTEMLASGIRTPLALQIFGSNLKEIEDKAKQAERLLQAIPLTRSAFADRSTGALYIDIEIDRTKAAFYGISINTIQNSIQSSIGGQSSVEVIRGRQRINVKVRYASDYRDQIIDFNNVLLKSPYQNMIPLSSVAHFQIKPGPPMIRSEAGQLSTYVMIDPGSTALATYIQAAQKAFINFKAPQGGRIQWIGQYQAMARTQERLQWMIPLTLLLILGLLYLNTRSWIECSIIMLAVPFSLIGSVWIMYYLGYHLSLAVWVGMIALAGLDAETGMIMLLYLKLSEKRSIQANQWHSFQDLLQAVEAGAVGRLRPKMMTVMTSIMGLSPLLWSEGAGADVMRRMAAPMLGGLCTSFLLELIVYPAIFVVWKRTTLKQRDH